MRAFTHHSSIDKEITLCGVHSDVIFCKAFLTCFTGRCDDTAAIVQTTNWQLELTKENK